MNFRQFKLSHFLYINILRIFLMILVYVLIRDSYYYFLNSKIHNFFTDFKNITKTFDEWFPIVITWSYSLLHFIIKFSIIVLLINIGQKFPVLSKWLSYWDKNGDISPILGKKIAQHFRFNKNVNISTILYFYEISNNEEKMLNYHAQNPEKTNFILKYDPNFKEDLNKKHTFKNIKNAKEERKVQETNNESE